MQKLFPTLRYRHPGAAIEWLSTALGFERHFVAEQDGHIVHAQLRFGGDLIFIGPDDPNDRYGMHSPLSLNGTNQCVCIALDSSVDQACERARGAGADIVTEPYDTLYGSREFSCRDPEGHVWCVGSYAGEPPSRSE
jgi:uncharacterized glyoxalase superfamily protein PhnB